MADTSIIGHESQIASLMKDVETENVAHAYLFTGGKHLGKFTVAKWFSKKLLTIDAKGEDEKRISHEVDRLIHPDLIVLDQLWIEDACEDFDVIARSSNVPQQHRSKAHARTDTIGIDDIRILQDRMHEVSRGRFRCCLIRSAERMQEEAVNALLKILEEPPPGVVFLLTSESLPSLLLTLISRTRIVRFSNPPYAKLMPLLQDLSDADAQFILRLSQGAPGIVFRLRNDADALRQERQQYASAATFWHTSSLAERLTLLEPLLERNEESKQFLLHLSLALREQPPAILSQWAETLHDFIRALRTNASRPLLIQRFAFSVHRQAGKR